jgi:hypothetical protein
VAGKRASDWSRTSERITDRDLGPDAHDLIRSTAELHGVGTDPLSAGAEGVRTRSEPAGGGGLFRRRRKANETAALIAPPFLVLVAGEVGERPDVTLYALDAIEVAEFASPLIEDSGVEITGFPLGATGERGTRFLPLDRGPAANAFRRALEDAVTAA